jgi:hypothetical protein
MPLEVRLRLPITYATTWDIEERLAEYTDSRNIDYDGGEEENEWEVHLFSGIAESEVVEIAQRMLPGNVKVEITEPGLVTALTPRMHWLDTVGPLDHPYDRALRRLCHRLSRDPEWTAWWKSTGHNQLWIQQTDVSQRNGRPWEFLEELVDGLLVGAWVDLSVLDEDKPPHDRVQRAAHQNLEIIMDEVSDHLHKPHPSFNKE